MNREAMKQALEALELLAKFESPYTKWQVRKPKDGGPIVTIYPHKVATDAATLLRDKLAQPEQDPVAWISESENLLSWDKFYDHMKPLYTAPREWVGLTDEEVSSIADSEWEEAFVRLVEAKLKDKNHG